MPCSRQHLTMSQQQAAKVMRRTKTAGRSVKGYGQSAETFARLGHACLAQRLLTKPPRLLQHRLSLSVPLIACDPYLLCCLRTPTAVAQTWLASTGSLEASLLDLRRNIT